MSISANEKRKTAAVGSLGDLRATVFNLPNQLTWLRLLLSVALFCLIAAAQDRSSQVLYFSSLVLFVIAAGTDWLDGYFARKYHMMTTLGRILDPFADKVIVCGTFIFLAAIPESGVRPWMSVVIVGRELLVTALRSFLEQQGADFSATLSGKLKMVLQCVAAGVSLYALSAVAGPGATTSPWLAWLLPDRQGPLFEPAMPPWLAWLLIGSVWSAVALTVVSGVAYIRTAINLLRQ
jgi:CDP-diacylglycerol--glycerol-3-phosphate 3-phosphatidyltransferase